MLRCRPTCLLPRRRTQQRCGRGAAQLACLLLLTGAAHRLPDALVLPSAGVEDEPNDDFEHATWIDLPVIDGQACIDPSGELDHYQFSFDTAGALLVSVRDQPGPGFGSQPQSGGAFSLTLYDEQQVRLATATDALEVPMLASGTYYLSISHVQKTCYLLNIYAGARHGGSCSAPHDKL